MRKSVYWRVPELSRVIRLIAFRRLNSSETNRASRDLGKIRLM
jgi:hypothetical protein